MKVNGANIFKKFFAVVLSLLIVTGSISLTAFAAETSGTLEGTDLVWTFSESTGELRISGNGEMKDFADISLIPWYEFRKQITSAVIEDGVTNIVKRAFYYCVNLTDVAIGGDVESIATDAFEGCKALQSVTIPENVNSISGNPFTGCLSLTEVVVDEDNSNFCTVDGVLFSSDMTVLITYPVGKTDTAYRVSRTVTKIADNAFRASELTEIILRAGLVNIGSYAFANNTKLHGISNLPNTLESIGSFAFAQCDSLEVIEFPESIQYIGNSAFYSCDKLAEIYIPDVLVKIGGLAFDDTAYYYNAERVDGALYIDNHLVDARDVEGYFIVRDGTLTIASQAFWSSNNKIDTVHIVDSVKVIGSRAFWGSNVKAVTIGCAFEIGSHAFWGCNNLEVVYMHEGVEEMGEFMFHGCDSLKHVFIPSTVTEIPRGAFLGCSSLESITFYNTVQVIDLWGLYDTSVEIYYLGTESEFDKIVIDEATKEVLKNCTIHYLDENHSHKFLTSVYEIEPTCTHQGFDIWACSCGLMAVGHAGYALGHDFGDWFVTKPATETENGIETRYCSRCDEAETREISITVHIHDYTAVVTPSTCTEGGYTTYTCACGDTYKGDVTATLGHLYGDWVVTKEPTATTAGQRVKTCKRCGYEIIRSISPTGDETHEHNYEIETVHQVETCASDGIYTYKCSVCGDTYIGTVEELGHDFGEWEIVTEPTYTTKGLKQRECSRCPTIETQEVDVHSNHVYDFKTEVVEPTCTEDGYTVRYCSCGAFVIDTYVPASEHNYVVDKIQQPASCASNGLYTYRCTVCGDTYTETVKALGHDFGEWEIVKEATATEKGLKQRECSRCPTIETVEIPIHNMHIYNADTVVVEPTCTEEGYTIRYCACGAVKRDTYVPANGHSYSDWEIIKEATQTEEGSKKRVCGVCSHEEIISIDKLPIEGEATLKVGNVKGRAGETVEISVRIDGNPGIIATHIMLDYDKDILTLKEVRDGEIFGTGNMTAGNDLTAVPYNVIFVDALAEENYASDGTLVTFVFEISADVPDSYTEVKIDYYAESTFNAELETVAFTLINGKVEIVNRIAGDANGDSLVNLKDVVIIERFLAGGWGVTLDESASDVNADGKVSLIDSVLINRYLADWDVTLI